ncbi:MAG: bifunctional UDP-N-acetylglucosamine diphosphorylase/glucosamine-1-phosphate N-acetyltransferase GlmU [Bradymonadales bacterium]|nr:bifunctional UDP-N-acetylglucosamine diphosphorylase/glucosamine-1-phosphate N-acetyltransferase GlmU [Bradymonadales bacterium]
MSELTVFILAAGLGTRMRSRRPKVLHHILGRPMLVPVVDLALACQPNRVILVLGHGRQQVEAELAQRYPDLAFQVALQEEQRGTGHAVQCALATHDRLSDGNSGEILVLSGDVPNLTLPTVQRMVDHTRVQKSPLGLLTTTLADPTGYGRVLRDDSQRILAVVEEKDASVTQKAIREINGGIYLFDAEFLREGIAGLEAANAAGELYLTDLVARAHQVDRPAVATAAPEPEEVLGINDRADLARAEAFARKRHNASWMQQGVTMTDPERTYLDASVRLAPDVLLGPGVALLGETEVESEVEIECGSVVKDCTIGRGARILAYSHLEGATIGPLAQVGPFARLRPGTRLGSRVRIGNFVEVKNSTIAEDSKANHLTYLGDARIGRAVNVGAGTITCNYDGRQKHPTTIEDEVFIGSDTQFVAPVTVGQGAIIAAGTTVTNPVPAGSLAISRVPQQNLEGYAHRRPEKG